MLKSLGGKEEMLKVGAKVKVNLWNGKVACKILQENAMDYLMECEDGTLAMMDKLCLSDYLRRQKTGKAS